MVAVSVVILLLVGAANAYTVIMLGGRRVEIPSSFVVTPATLTYEISDGIQITLPIAAIDIAATEKANHEQPGSLLARIKTGTSPSNQSWRQSTSDAKRTITNRDLETLKRRREDSNAAYETKRKQLGLPSIEESRKQAAAEFDLTTAELAQKRNAEKQTEDYWRTRAAALRSEMAVLDAELNYIRARLDEVPFAMGVNSGGALFSSGDILGDFRLVGNVGVWHRPDLRGRSSLGANLTRRPNLYVAPSYGPQLRAGINFGGRATSGHATVSRGGLRHTRHIGAGGFFQTLPTVLVPGPSVQDYYLSSERSALITRFNELAAARAGLNVRWRELEDEARRGGVSPGWLRP
jgi:hypothetical protein